MTPLAIVFLVAMEAFVIVGLLQRSTSGAATCLVGAIFCIVGALVA